MPAVTQSQIELFRPYKPNAKQTLAHQCSARWVLYGGGFGGGKTRWLVEEVITLLLEYPGIEIPVARYDYAALHEPTQIYDLFMRCLPPELIKQHYKSPPAWVQLVNASRVIFVGLKDWKAGAEYGQFAIDQAEEVPAETLRLLAARLRQLLPDGKRPPYRMLLTCNPAPGFLKENFVDNHDDQHVFIPALADDNKENLPYDYVDQMRKALTEDEFERFMRGNWEAFRGQALSEYNRDIHIIPYFDTWRREYWPVWRGIDHGVAGPTVCEWMTRDDDGNYFFCQEYSREEEVPKNNARAIAAMSFGMNIMASWIDPRVAQIRADLQNSPDWNVLDEYQKQGVFCQRALGTRENRLAAWKQALKPTPDRRHYITKQPGGPMVYIMNTCARLMKELPEVQYAPAAGAGYRDDIIKIADHAYDAGGFILSNLLKRVDSNFGRQRPAIVGVRLS